MNFAPQINFFARAHAYLCAKDVYLYKWAAHSGPRFDLPKMTILDQKPPMKSQRHTAIREVVASSTVTNQDELRQKLIQRGIEVTQATLSRDINEMRLSKGPDGYSLPSRNNASEEDDSPPSVAEMIESFGLRVRQAMNQVLVRTVKGGAQPLAAALDYEGWTDVVGTLAGDDTVLIICADPPHAAEVESRLRKMLES